MRYVMLLVHQPCVVENKARLEELSAVVLDVEQNHILFQGTYTNLVGECEFVAMIGELVVQMTQIYRRLTNLLVLFDDDSLLNLLLSECTTNSLQLPFLFRNFLKWKDICARKFQCEANLVGICRVLQVDDKLSGIQSMHQICLKMHANNLLTPLKQNLDTCITLTGHYRFFKCIGLPFRLTVKDALEAIVKPEEGHESFCEMYFIEEHGRFSGKAVLKVPEQYQDKVESSDKMYIGTRYVDIVNSTEFEFQQYKTRALRERDPRPNSRSSSRQANRKRDRRSPQGRGDGLYLAMRIRGLPFAYNEWNIQNLFGEYNIQRGSVRMGYKHGRLSGEAVVLFKDEAEASRAMQLDRVTVLGRYLELKVISAEEYTRFQ